MTRWVIISCLLLNPPLLIAQQPVDRAKDERAIAEQEIESVITDANKLNNNKYATVNITARAAMLVSYSDPVRAEKMLIDLWKLVNEQTGNDFDKRKARVLVLKYLHSRNPKLARRLMSERPQQDKSSSLSRAPGFDDESSLEGQLARALLDTDPSAAAAVLEQSLSTGVTMASVGALTALRERNFLLADYVAAKAIEALTIQPTFASLPGLNFLGTYVFPGAEAPATSIDAESSRQLLQSRYFSAAHDVLRASLNETSEALIKDQHYTDRLLQFRGMYQAEVAAILAALAPRFQPSLAAELSDIARRLAPQVPPNMPRLTQSMLAKLSGNFSSEDPEQRFFFALSKPDFDEARKELDRINPTEKRNLYTQLLIKTEARAFLARSELMEAVTAIRKLEDPIARLVMYLDALKTAKKKRDDDVARIIIDEARLMVPQTGRNGLHLRALLSFATQLAKLGANDEAVEFLRNAVSTINTLGGDAKKKGDANSLAEAAMAELDDPMTLLDEPDMENAFSSVGLIELSSGLTEARRIQPRAVQLVARLEAIQAIIKRSALQPKPPKKSSAVSAPKQ